MARSRWILPRADAACGKAFHADRRSVEGHRVALEFFRQATGHKKDGYRLVPYRCKRCGGFHLVNRKVGPEPVPVDARPVPDFPEGYWIEPELDAVEEFDGLALSAAGDGY